MAVVPYQFQNTPGGATLPLAQLDANFAFLANGNADFSNLVVNGQITFNGTVIPGVTGSGLMVLANSPTLTSPNLGVVASGILTNCTGLPVSTGLTGLGTGVSTALGLAVNTANGLLTYPSPAGAAGEVLTINSSGQPYWGPAGTTTSITNDVASNATEYPLFASVTSGVATTLYTSSPNYTYNPATGVLASPRPASTSGFYLCAQNIVASYTIPAGYNAQSTGPIALAAGVIITVPAGAAWVVV